MAFPHTKNTKAELTEAQLEQKLDRAAQITCPHCKKLVSQLFKVRVIFTACAACRVKLEDEARMIDEAEYCEDMRLRHLGIG